MGSPAARVLPPSTHLVCLHVGQPSIHLPAATATGIDLHVDAAAMTELAIFCFSRQGHGQARGSGPPGGGTQGGGSRRRQCSMLQCTTRSGRVPHGRSGFVRICVRRLAGTAAERAGSTSPAKPRAARKRAWRAAAPGVGGWFAAEATSARRASARSNSLEPQRLGARTVRGASPCWDNSCSMRAVPKRPARACTRLSMKRCWSR